MFKWRIGDIKGKGKFGEVYTGLNMSNGKIFAVKKIILSNGANNIDLKYKKAIEVC